MHLSVPEIARSERHSFTGACRAPPSRTMEVMGKPPDRCQWEVPSLEAKKDDRSRRQKGDTPIWRVLVSLSWDWAVLFEYQTT